MKRITVPFFISHQGCPQACIFCDQHSISGSNGNLPTRNEILAKIQKWRRFAGNCPLEVAFFGGTFSALPLDAQEQLLEPLQPLLASGEVASIRISTRPDAIDGGTVQRLAGLGVATIEIGVQSMDDAVLESAGRGHNAAASAAALRCIRANGLSAGAQLMPGLPGDTPAISLYSLERVIAAGACFVRLYPALVLAGTELGRRYLSGEYQPLDVAGGVAVCKVLLRAALKAGVPVIRIGLQADQGLNDENVLAGCWHPALGQLVRAELFFDLLLQLASGLTDTPALTVSCHPSRLADVIGHERKNIKRLHERGIRIERVLPDRTLSLCEIHVCGSGRGVRGNILSDLQGPHA